MRSHTGGPLLLVLALCLGACGQTTVEPPTEPVGQTAEGTGTVWTSLPDSPLSPRERALAFWVNGRALILGGSDAAPCPPNAGCAAPLEPALRDGAAFDPATGTWTPIADAPMPLEQARGVVVGGRVYLLVNETDFLAYDPVTDEWWTLASPESASPAWRAPAVVDGTVVAYVSSHEHDEGRLAPDLRYEPGLGLWQPVVPDPLGPGFDRVVVGTDHGMVLLQAPLVENPGAGARPSLWEAAVLDDDGTWRRLPRSEILSGYREWSRAGGRLVAASRDAADGGGAPPGDYGRSYPYGGLLDVAAGEWEPLPPSDTPRWSWQAVFAHSDALVFHDGALLDVRARQWTDVPTPPAAQRWGTSAVWAGDRLLLWGGSSFATSEQGVLHDDGWYWMPTG